MAGPLWLDLLFVLIGLVLLTVGAEFLVRGAARLAILFGVPPIVVGLTIVAYGTSTPELVVSAQAALKNEASVAIGNALGSNIFNLLVVLGVTALVLPVPCNAKFVEREVPVVIGATVLLPIMVLIGAWYNGTDKDLKLEHWGGWIFLTLLVVYTVITYRRSGAGNGDVPEEIKEIAEAEKKPHGPGHVALQVVLVLIGTGLLVGGAHLLLNGSLSIARAIGIPELVIGLTLVAIGTSLPELATSVVAALRGHSDICVGNVVGSSTFNLLGVLGLSATLQRLPMTNEVLFRDIPVALGSAVICLPIMLTGRRISRGEGGFLLSLYVVYTGVLIWMSRTH